MSDLTLTFKKAGLFTSIQDNGRKGYEDKGVVVGGSMDRKAAHDAQKLVGNSLDEPILEITLLGPKIHFNNNAIIAVTGAIFPLKLNGEPVNSYEKIEITAESILEFGYAEKGCRAYLAISANWKLNKWLGSVSPLKLGGSSNSGILTEHIVKDGQTLHLTDRNTDKIAYDLSDINPSNLSTVKRIRVSLGPEFENLSKEAIAHLFGQAHKISNEASRMGYKLETQLALNGENQEMISSAILPGTIQLTTGGQAIILLADAQTMGGYPRILRVIKEDMDTLAQMKSGDKIWLSLSD